MVALAIEHDGADIRRQAGEKGLDPADQRVVDGVALFRPRQPQKADFPVAFGGDGGGQILDIELGPWHGSPGGPQAFAHNCCH